MSAAHTPPSGYACIVNPHCPGVHASKHQICSHIEETYSVALNELVRYIDLQQKLGYREYAAETEKALHAMVPVTRAVFAHDALVAALEKYGRHRFDDRGSPCQAVLSEHGECTCGFRAALKAAKGEA